MDSLVNFGYSLVATAPSPATSGTTLVVTSGDGAKFPAAPFDLTLYPVGQLPLIGNAEIVRCTNVSTDTLTIARHQYGTTAQSVAVGWAVDNAVTANLLTQINQNLGLTQLNAATSGTFTAAIGDIIETSGASTITLPASPAIGNCVFVARGNHSSLITINAGAGQTINGQSSVSMYGNTSGSYAYTGQCLFIAQSSTEWNCVAIGTDAGLGMVLGGGLKLDFNVVTANYSTGQNDLWIRCQTNSFTVTLTNEAGKIIIVTSETTGQNITVVGSSAAVQGPSTLPGGSFAIYICSGVTWRCFGVYGMSNTSPTATASTPTFANGIAAQLAQTYQDAEIYFQIGTAGTAFALAIGPTSGVANTVMTGATVASGQQIRVRLPAGWYLKWSATTATLSVQEAMTC
jgi:hypothetical protein